MDKSLVYIEKDGDAIYHTSVISDSQQVLLYDINEGGRTVFDDFYNEWEINEGYYLVDYKWEMETECWEMPSIKYPVIEELHLIEVHGLVGLFLQYWTKLVFFLQRRSVYDRM